MDTINNIFEVIRKRRSVRTFDDTALRAEDAHKIMDFALAVKNPYEIAITWKLLDAAKSKLGCPVIVGTDTFIAGKMNRVPNAEEAFGYAFEKIVLYAQSLGIGTTWIAGTMDRAAFEKVMELSPVEVMPCVSPLGYPAKKMSFRESMMRKGVKADSRYDFAKLFFEGSFDKALSLEKAGKLKDILEAVRLAPSAVNKQPWRLVLCGDKVHFYEKRSKGYVSADGWDLQKVDMGIALAHFELAANACGLETAFNVEDPGIPMDSDTAYIATYTCTGSGM